MIELCLGMLMTAMIAGGVAAIADVTARQWNDNRQRQLLGVTVQQHRHSVGSIVRAARSLGGVVTKYKTGVFFWQADTYGGTPDGVAQYAEMALIEYDPATKSILYYQADAASLSAASAYASSTVTGSYMADPDVANYFKQMTWVKSARSLLGPGRTIDDDMETARVTSAAFVVTKASNLQTLQLNVTVERGTLTQTFTDVYGVRAPATTN
jgi:hypothetical protein